MATTTSSTAPPIEFEGVTKKFGARTVLNDLSFSVPEGSVVGLLGPNGAGKSTAMRVLLGLQHATSGEARILGHKPGTAGFRTAVRRVGSIIEAPPLFRNATAMQNLEIRVAAVGMSTRDADVRQALTDVGLEERVDDKVGSFSLGMRQRVGLALALVGDPRIVVLDEPTNGLDPEGAVEIRTIVKALPERGATTLLCTHRLNEVESTCNYVVVLRQGHLVAQGSVTELIDSVGSRGITLTVDADEVPTALGVIERMGLAASAPERGTVAISDDNVDTSAVNRALVESGVYLSTLERHRASLEDAFLEITRQADAEAAS